MNLLLSASADAPQADWIVKSFPIIKIILAVIILLLSIIMIVAVISQKGNTNGIAGVTGESDTFYNRNKGQSLQGKVKKLTIWVASILLVCCIAFLILNSIYAGV
ncbi:MAG: preprotein translocase subunit SecG [Clostridia bacterium]